MIRNTNSFDYRLAIESVHTGAKALCFLRSI